MWGDRFGRMWFACCVLAVLPACQLIVGSDEPVPLALDSLVISPGGLDQGFDPETRSYTATLSYTDAIKVIPRSSDPDVSIRVTSSVFPEDALIHPNGAQHDVRTLSGENRLTILVSTPLGITTSYTVDVTVPGARFGAPAKIPQTGNAASVKTADFDGDGTPDILVCSSNGVFLFDAMTRAPLGGGIGGAPCLDVAIGDVDNAKGLDLVVATNSGNATLFLNRGLSTVQFDPPAALGGGTSYISVALGLLDADNNLDLVLGDGEQGPPFGRVQWRLGNGNGTFGTLTNLAGPVGQPVTLILDELDADPGVDLVSLDGDGAAFALVHGDGAGVLTFDTATDTSPTPVQETSARSLVRVTADAVPAPDFALVHGDRNELAVIRNFAGSDTVSAELDHTVFPTETTPRSVVAADLDRDGHEDLIVACKNAAPAPGNPTAGKVMVFYGNGAGGYVPMSFASPAPIGVAVADFNGDELPDLAILSETSTEGVHILLQEAP